MIVVAMLEMIEYSITMRKVVAMTEVYLDLEDGVRMREDKGVCSRFFAVPNIPGPEIAKYRQFKSVTHLILTHPWSIIGPASTGGRMYLVDSLRTGEGSRCLRKGRRHQCTAVGFKKD